MRCFPYFEPPDGDAPALLPMPGNLPAELTPFIGRQAELAELQRRLAEARLVTVTGVGGAGKSRCALRVAAQQQERFCDGVWLVELAALRDAALLEHTVSEALGLADQTGRPACLGLSDQLADRQLLLVLDGFEYLAEESAMLVYDLLRKAPGLRVLAAGRCPLEVPGEQVFSLPPMNAPDPAHLSGSEVLGVSDATALFADRAAAVLPGFHVTEDNQRVVAELCHRLDGIPLALELAAGRLRSLSVEQVLHRLDDRFQLLTGDSRGGPAHHRTLRTAIGWSHELCAPRERLLWARLSVFAGHFDLEAAEYVCSGAGLPADEVLDGVDALIAQSVVLRQHTSAGVSYRMLDTVRSYGAGWLAAIGETGRVRRRHRDWYMGLATWCELDWFSPRQAEVAARIDSELPNLRVALECALEDEDDTRLGPYLAGTLWFYWIGCGRLTEGRHWLDRALDVDTGHRDVRLKALWVTGYVAILQGDTVRAVAALQECREEAERTGNTLAIAYSMHRAGCLALVSDDLQRAEQLIRAAFARYEDVGELNSTVLMSRVELALVIAFQGDLPGAATLCHEVRAICEDHGERWTYSYALCVLGFVAWRRQDTAEAREFLEESLSIAQGFHDVMGVVLSIGMLALVTATDGDPAEATVLQGAAGQLWRTAGLPPLNSRYFGGPPALCRRQTRQQLGTERYEECLREGERLSLDNAVARAIRPLRNGPPRRAPKAQTTGRTDPSYVPGQPASSPFTGGRESAN